MLVACHQGHFKPSGSLCTFRRCTGGSAQDCHGVRLQQVPLNSSRPLRTFPRAGTVLDESPALTAVLQAQPRPIVPLQAIRGRSAGGARERLVQRALEPADLAHPRRMRDVRRARARPGHRVRLAVVAGGERERREQHGDSAVHDGHPSCQRLRQR